MFYVRLLLPVLRVSDFRLHGYRRESNAGAIAENN